jgi:hypothetical protein
MQGSCNASNDEATRTGSQSRRMRHPEKTKLQNYTNTIISTRKERSSKDQAKNYNTTIQ